MTTTALITGANKGIGYETARLLAARGTTVLVGARNPELGRAAAEKLKADGADARFVQLDVTDDESIGRAAEYIGSEFGKLDILVNNAAITGGLEGDGKASSTTLATLRKVYETNVFGVVAVTNAMLPLLRGAEAARIVNVSSEVGSMTLTFDPDSPMWQLGAIPYPSSKSALNMITTLYAKELWDTPIKVNAANPGYTATDLNGRTGFRTPEQGAAPTVHLATLPADGPTGQLWGYIWGAEEGEEYGPLPW
ncbi:SDR family oxidoreductase [Nocardia mexicana]|uniref:NAD(P)-dependent dehydrogenase (Short-subunit alcohol dehydrogenase family) n=1 Tax=Nocardia mexicana TaxID=279262 RepID=A0A370GVE2_9NOCA|nr:SDR family oxidoreductase [Nocardia mexicana]RDI47230.1 NAD(P)-dependent dehydrogenase (short-subunit alcohol dehydrogenase family) [Nocardia mexicana]